MPESVGVTSGQSWIPTSGLPSAPWVGYTPWAYSPAASRLDLLGNGRISDSCWTPPFMIAVSSPHAGMCTSNGCSDIACLHISHWYSHLPWRRRRNSPLCVRVHWLAPTLLAFLWASGFSFVWAHGTVAVIPRPCSRYPLGVSQLQLGWFSSRTC